MGRVSNWCKIGDRFEYVKEGKEFGVVGVEKGRVQLMNMENGGVMSVSVYWLRQKVVSLEMKKVSKYSNAEDIGELREKFEKVFERGCCVLCGGVRYQNTGPIELDDKEEDILLRCLDCGDVARVGDRKECQDNGGVKRSVDVSEVFGCECGSLDHVCEIKKVDDEVYLTVKLKSGGFWSRLVRGLLYIVGWNRFGGCYDEFILKDKDREKVRDILK